MTAMHISEQVAAELKRQGWRSDGNIYARRIDNFAESGTVSDGARVVFLCLDITGRWLERQDGWGETEREIDLRDYPDNPQAAITAVLATTPDTHRLQNTSPEETRLALYAKHGMMDARDDPTWRIASNGAGKRRWGVARYAGREWAEGSDGRTRRFASWQAAQKAADELNR